MDMQTAVKTVLSKYATFSGRASRPEFWWWFLATVILFLVLHLLDARALSALISLAILIPNLAVGCRRLHDSDRTGWWLLISVIPIIGTLVLLYFLVQPSDEGENRFG